MLIVSFGLPSTTKRLGEIALILVLICSISGYGPVVYSCLIGYTSHLDARIGRFFKAIECDSFKLFF